MKAELFTYEVYDGVLDFTHGYSREVRAIFIPEASNLVVNLSGDNFYAYYNFKKNRSCKTFKVIEIDDNLVKKIIDFIKNRDELIVEIGKIEIPD